MNALELLKNEHEKANRAFGKIQAASADQRAQLWARLEPELKVHAEMEETALYGPVAQEVGSRNQKLKEWLEHHRAEVLKAGALIQEIGRLDPTTDEWIERRWRSCKRHWSITSRKKKATSGPRSNRHGISRSSSTLGDRWRP